MIIDISSDDYRAITGRLETWSTDLAELRKRPASMGSAASMGSYPMDEITVQICKPIEVECEIFAPRFYRWKIPHHICKCGQ